MLDGHAMCISDAAPGAVFLACRMGLFRSDDGATSWQDIEVGRFSPLTYARDIRPAPQDPRTLYACLSVHATGNTGSLARATISARAGGASITACRSTRPSCSSRFMRAMPTRSMARRATARSSARRMAARAGTNTACPKAARMFTASPAADASSRVNLKLTIRRRVYPDHGDSRARYRLRPPVEA